MLPSIARIRAVVLAACSSLALTACLLSPGEFISEMHLKSDGKFTYSYDGEIQMIGLSQLAKMGAESDETFEAECYDDDFDTRECTLAEVNEQRAEWDADASERAAERAQGKQRIKAMFGGIDPSDPEAADELARRLERQRGWERVVHKGDGLFDVDFRVESTMTHGFVFPMVEKLPFSNAFVTMMLRDNNQVRIDAPGFAVSDDSGNPMQGMMAGMSGLMMLGSEDEDGQTPRVTLPDGTFTILTDGDILANNTDEGATATARGKALVWRITARTKDAPTALIAFN